MSLGSHQSTIGKSQTYVTPRDIIDRLGPFDLDPCAADPRPFDCAKENWSTDGLREWPAEARVWLNPPFHRYHVGRWVERLSTHPGGGIALLHARTEAAWFRPIWDRASGIHFLDKRVTFLRQDGTPHPANSGAPVVLAAFGAWAADRVRQRGGPGWSVSTWQSFPGG